MKTQATWEEMSAEANQDRRREKRVALSFPIEVCGLDVEERIFTENCVTTSVSRSGCRLRLKTQPAPGTMVAIKLLHGDASEPDSNRPLMFEIVWIKRDGDGWSAGAHALQKGNHWGIDFPKDVVESCSPYNPDIPKN